MKACEQALFARLPAPLTREQARAIYEQGPEAVIFALMELSARAADLDAPPAQAAAPAQGPHTPSGVIPAYEKPSRRKRGKKPGAQPGHAGRRRPAPEAMPKAMFGHRLVMLTAWLHYGLGLSISQIQQVLRHHAHLDLTGGGLADAWRRLGEVLSEWYDQIGAQAREAGVLHADEAGWRVDGQTHWLWCFTTRKATYYQIDWSRGSAAPRAAAGPS